ncbi:MAG: AraC family transcriptional regulator [Sphaerochaetaceae bacterium]|nr:AraC family transcriptional regulator [Sphaerochaetaceae bacterium]
MYDIKERAIILSSVLNLPVFLAEKGMVEPISSGGISMELIPLLSNLFMLFSQDSMSVKPPYYTHLIRINDLMGTTTLNVANLSREGISAIIFGPVFLGEEKKNQFINNLVSMEGKNISPAKAQILADTISIKDMNYVENWGKLVLTFFESPKLKLRDIHKINLDGNYFNYDGVLSFEEGRMRESEIYASYTFEHELSQLIRLGDKSRLKKMLSNYHGVIGDIRNTRSRLIRLDSRFQYSAEEAGLPPVVTHTISEKVRSRIDAVRTLDDAKEIADTIIELYCDAINRSFLQNRNAKILRIQKYITGNLDKKFRLEDLSRVVGISPEYLCRLFKLETHMTITAYIQQLRINEAIWLLRNTETPIVEISQSVGFQDQSNFTRVFVKHTGQTPSGYRKTHSQH